VKQTRRLILVAIFSFVIVSSTIGIPLYFHYRSIYILPITIISYQLNPSVGEEWVLNGTIRISDSCWKFKSPIIKMDEQKKEVSIIIKAKRDYGSICLAMVFYIEKTISLIFPISGQWRVRCNDKIITVYAQEN